MEELILWGQLIELKSTMAHSSMESPFVFAELSKIPHTDDIVAAKYS